MSVEETYISTLLKSLSDGFVHDKMMPPLSGCAERLEISAGGISSEAEEQPVNATNTHKRIKIVKTVNRRFISKTFHTMIEPSPSYIIQYFATTVYLPASILPIIFAGK